MNEMNILTLNGEQYEVADQKARTEKLDIAPLGEATGQDVQEVHYNPVTKKLMTKKGGGGGGSDINDTVVATDSTWSSKKITDSITAIHPYVPVTMTGTTVSTDIVSPVEHDIKCRVESKNLIPFPYLESSHTDSGITYTVNPDGTVTAKGRLTSDMSVFRFNNPRNGSKEIITDGKSVTLSGCPMGGSIEKYLIQLQYHTVDYPPELYANDTGNGVTIEGQTKIGSIAIFILSDIPDGLTFKPMLNYGNVALPYTPYVDVKSVTVTQNPGGKTFKPFSDGTVVGMESVSPSMTVSADNTNAVIKATYNADTLKYIDSKSQVLTDAILSLGGNV